MKAGKGCVGKQRKVRLRLWQPASLHANNRLTSHGGYTSMSTVAAALLPASMPCVAAETATGASLGDLIRRDPRCQLADHSADKLLSVVRLAERAQLDTQRWFDGLPLTRTQLDDPSLLVSYRTAHLFLSRALQRLNLPDAGLEIGAQGDVGDFGLLGLAILTSGTLGEALSAAMEHYRVCGCMLELSAEPVDDGVLALVAHQPFNDVGLEPFFCEELFASCTSIARKLAGKDFAPLRMELRYSAPAYAGRYTELFRCPVHFAAERNRLLVDVRWLALPLPGHNPLTSRQALALCAERIVPMDELGSRPELVVAVERALREQLPRAPRMSDVAKRLNLSERTLRRKLAEAGVVFRELHDRVRAEFATHLLQQRQLSVTEVGVRVGFNDSREFRRAFKRWTGLAPTEVRHAGPVVPPMPYRFVA